MWMNDEVKYMWEAIYLAEKEMDAIIDLTTTAGKINPTLRRIILQAMRELMLLQASDWEFLVSTHSAKDYAEMRFFYHHSDFSKLCELAKKFSTSKKLAKKEKEYLEDCEKRNQIFSELRTEWWQ